jgi:hypothetical protein
MCLFSGAPARAAAGWYVLIYCMSRHAENYYIMPNVAASVLFLVMPCRAVLWALQVWVWCWW